MGGQGRGWGQEGSGGEETGVLGKTPGREVTLLRQARNRAMELPGGYGA